MEGRRGAHEEPPKEEPVLTRPPSARRHRGRLLRAASAENRAGEPSPAPSPAPDPAAVVELARLLAKRIVGHALAVSDEALRHWADAVIREARGARSVHLIAAPEDAERLHELARELTEEGRRVCVSADPELARGAFRVETELGTLEASVDRALEVLVGLLGAGPGRRGTGAG